MGVNLSAVMLLMGAGMAQDVEECGNIRVLGFYLQDVTGSFNKVLGSGGSFAYEVSKFLDKVDSVYPGSMFGVYSFTDRVYASNGTVRGVGDFLKFTALADIPTAKSEVSKVVPSPGGGYNTGAFDVMYHLIVNNADSGLDKVTPLADTYDAKILYVFSDGIPEYLESTKEDCIVPSGSSGYACGYMCGDEMSTHCCDYDSSSGVYSPKTSLADYGTAWNSFAECPIDLLTLGKKINDDDWYVAYIAADDSPDAVYKWDKQVPLMGIESRFTSYGVDYKYSGLSDALVNVTSKIMCSAVPSNNPSGLPTGGATNPPTTAGPTTAPSTGGSPTGGSPTGGPTTGGLTHNSLPWPAVHLLV